MKKINLPPISLLSLIGLVSAHTGNDLYDHGFTIYDGVIGIVIIVVLAIIVKYLIKKRKNKRK